MSGQVLHEMLPAAATAQGHRVLGHFNIETNKNENCFDFDKSSSCPWPSGDRFSEKVNHLQLTAYAFNASKGIHVIINLAP